MARSVSRRDFVGLGAAGGAALLGGRTVAPAAGAVSVPLAAGEPRALPIPTVPGAVTVTLSHLDFEPDTTTTDTREVAPIPRRARRVPTGALYGMFNPPPGSLLARIDVFGYTDAEADQDWDFVRYDATATGAVTSLLTTTVTGTGAITGALVPSTPITFAAGQSGAVLVATDTTMWVRGAVVQYLPPPPTGALVPIVPTRVYDSRATGAKLGPDEERTISVAVAADGSGEVVPAGATVVAITITVTETEGGGGFVAAFPAETVWPGTSTVNWFGPGQNLATAAILALGGDRQLTLRGGNAATHVVVDVTAYVR